MSDTFIESSLARPDTDFEIPLRPQCLDDFAGQESIRERLKILISAARGRNDALGHCLFCGPPGLGKTTLANIMAKAMGSTITITSGPALEKAGDIAGILTSLKKGDILFIDELHRLNKAVEENLYSAMEDFALDIVIDSGPNARSVRVNLNAFTLIGATTKSGLISAPMRTRFVFTCRLDPYPCDILTEIILRSAALLKLKMDEKAAAAIAMRSRGTPRIANNLTRWVRDYAQIYCDNVVDEHIAHKALDLLAIDGKGLDEMDKKILEVIIDYYQGGPVGLNTIAVAVGEEPHTLEEVYEPFLIAQGFIKRTARGREATPQAYQHLSRERHGAGN